MAKRTQREDGRFGAKISTGDGKYKYVYAPSEKELEQKIREVEKRRDRGLDLSADRDSFGYWVQKWLKIKKSEVSAKYYDCCSSAADKLDVLSPVEIVDLRATDLQEILIDLTSATSPKTGRQYARRTIKLVKDVAASVMELAIENRVIEFNPFAKVKVPKNAKEAVEREALTEEQREWVDNTPHRAQTAAMIMLYAGLRRGELLPLKWCDIDLENKTIDINKSVEYVNGSAHIKKGGKTKAAVRTVFIPQKLVDYLKPLQGAPFELVCPSARGVLMSDTSWRRLWESYMCDLNIKYGKWENQINGSKAPKSKYAPEKLPMVIETFTAHQLRHTYITMLYMAGIDVLTAKEQAGHADIQTTLGIYTHLNAEYKRQNLSKFDQFLNAELKGQGCQFGCQTIDKAHG